MLRWTASRFSNRPYKRGSSKPSAILFATSLSRSVRAYGFSCPGSVGLRSPLMTRLTSRPCGAPTQGGLPCARPGVFWADEHPEHCYQHASIETRRAGEVYEAERRRERTRSDRAAEISYRSRVEGLPPIPTGLSEEEQWSHFVKVHDGRCAICQHPDDSLQTNHDRGSALVRGLLCRGCNASEGTGDGSARFRVYRERPPAAVIGLAVRYFDPSLGREAVPQPTGAGASESALAALRQFLKHEDVKGSH